MSTVSLPGINFIHEAAGIRNPLTGISPSRAARSAWSRLFTSYLLSPDEKICARNDLAVEIGIEPARRRSKLRGEIALT
jgi:hypothetical protein